MKHLFGKTSLCVVVGWLVVIGCLALAACAPADPRESVSGTVTLDGKPVTQGTVIFEPTKDNANPSTGTKIAGGEFSLPRKNGVMPGTYLIKVSALRETGRMVEGLGKQISEAVPVNLKEAAGIPATVVKGGPNRFELHVHSEKP
jgi:hypothetical protein